MSIGFAAFKRLLRSGRRQGSASGAGAIAALTLALNVLTVGQAIAAPTATKISNGGNTSCAVLSSGKLECWGNNSYGQLGIGSEDSNAHNIPNVVPGLSNVTSVSVGLNDVCAIRSGGDLKCWGNNFSGQVGNGTSGLNDVTSPAQVLGLSSGVKSVSVGSYDVCALLGNGSAKCWGSNLYGAVGNGTSGPNVTSPAQVAGLYFGVTAISAGSHHGCAVQDGHALCWGYNGDGNLGDGSTGGTSDIPVPLPGLTRHVTAISAGYYGGCAIQNGGAKCWGLNTAGEVGDGTLDPHDSGVKVAGMSSGVTSIDTDGYFACAVQNGRAKCWGDNTYKQLGDGTANPHYTPHQVTGLTRGVSRIDAAVNHACALMSSGIEKCWGWNFLGQAGNGSTDTYIPTPVKVHL